MAIVYPYALPVLADRLAIASVVWDIQRNDEMSGIGDGRVWQAELAPPLWTADVVLSDDLHNEVKQVAALIRKLHGSQESFMLYDPLSMYPQADPKGLILGAHFVQLKTIGANRQSVSLKGLPGGYTLTLADKMQVLYASGGSRNFFCEVSDTITANEDGETAEFEIFPHVPVGVAADDAVVLKRPACKVFVPPNAFKPGTARGAITSGATFKVIERRR
ncbi:MAG: hypothetical protein ACRC9K_12160 [Afipia sp.]